MEKVTVTEVKTYNDEVYHLDSSAYQPAIAALTSGVQFIELQPGLAIAAKYIKSVALTELSGFEAMKYDARGENNGTLSSGKS